MTGWSHSAFQVQAQLMGDKARDRQDEERIRTAKHALVNEVAEREALCRSGEVCGRQCALHANEDTAQFTWDCYLNLILRAA